MVSDHREYFYHHFCDFLFHILIHHENTAKKQWWHQWGGGEARGIYPPVAGSAPTCPTPILKGKNGKNQAFSAILLYTTGTHFAPSMPPHKKWSGATTAKKYKQAWYWSSGSWDKLHIYWLIFKFNICRQHSKLYFKLGRSIYQAVCK